MSETMIKIIFSGLLLYGIITFFQGVRKSWKTGSYKEIHSQKQMHDYVCKRAEINLRHCKDLPRYDSKGHNIELIGSFTDKTGKYSEAYKRDMEKLNNEYARPGSEEYKKIREREAAWNAGKRW